MVAQRAGERVAVLAELLPGASSANIAAFTDGIDCTSSTVRGQSSRAEGSGSPYHLSKALPPAPEERVEADVVVPGRGPDVAPPVRRSASSRIACQFVAQGLELGQCPMSSNGVVGTADKRYMSAL